MCISMSICWRINEEKGKGDITHAVRCKSEVPCCTIPMMGNNKSRQLNVVRCERKQTWGYDIRLHVEWTIHCTWYRYSWFIRCAVLCASERQACNRRGTHNSTLHSIEETKEKRLSGDKKSGTEGNPMLYEATMEQVLCTLARRMYQTTLILRIKLEEGNSILCTGASLRVFNSVNCTPTTSVPEYQVQY